MADFIPGLDLHAKHSSQPIGGVCSYGVEMEFIFGQGTQIFPNLPVPIWGVQTSRVVEDAGEKWFEFGFKIDAQLVGNSATGWTDDGNYIRLEPQWSDDLATWHMGKFLPAPVPVVEVEPGVWEYWSRASHPVDSASKTGQLTAGYPNGFGEGDVRNNPFTSLIIAGVAIALPRFPYLMPTDAAALQEDIRAAGWPAATVTASSDIAWQITLPDIALTDYTQVVLIGWPTYLVADQFGAIVNPVFGAQFVGSYVDAAGTSIADKRGFGRLKLSAGPRYAAYR
jgi:hypothetical protein